MDLTLSHEGLPRAMVPQTCSEPKCGMRGRRTCAPLAQVHVQQNGIRELPVEHLLPLQRVHTLDFSMNDVSALPPQLALLPRLQNLTIIGNPIRAIPQSVSSTHGSNPLPLSLSVRTI